ncbi:MAG: hypothetical protein IPK16_24260 [Anaerolineales bacterium]|nr:hypothetical protein [Anaerolineales bacterium]
MPDAIPVVEALLTESPKLSCVVTTREALDTPWEWRYDLAELSYPMSLDDNLRHGEYGAVQLFLQIARRTRPRLAIQRAELPKWCVSANLSGACHLALNLPPHKSDGCLCH